MSDENLKIQKEPIRLTIKKDDPLDIITLSKALYSLNASIKEYLAKKESFTDLSISLDGVEKGSDVFNLVIVGVGMFSSLIVGLNSYFDFFNNIKNIGKKSVDDIKNDEFLTKTALDDMENIVNLSENRDVIINYNNYESCVIINQENKNSYLEGIKIARQIKGVEILEKKDFNKVLIKIQTIKDSDKVVQDRAICDEILPKKIMPTEIINKEAKELIKKSPFDNYFLVDLSVKKIDGNIKLYIVTKLHNIIPKEQKE